MKEEPKSPLASPLSSLWRAEIFVLFSIGLLHNLDRTIMSGLLQPIKEDFGLSDAATGALSGMAFGIAYVTLGLPLARVADMGNRRWILAISLALWSALTIACGFAAGFWTFFAARLGVGFFEAAGTPAMFALCADRVAPGRRSRAASILVFGTAIGAMIGITGGGAIAQWAGWREAFWLGGLPGLLLAPLAFRFLVEPRPVPQFRIASLFGSMHSAYAGLLRKPAFRYVVLGAMTLALWYWGTATWFITYLVRSHGMSLAQASFGYGVLTGVSSLVGISLNGMLGDRLVQRDTRWLGWLPAAAVLACTAFAVFIFIVPSGTAALVLYMICSIFTGVIVPAQVAAVYALAGVRARGAAVAVLHFCIYLVGLAIAPAAVGAISDALLPTRGEDSLAMSLLIITGTLPLAALFYFLSTRHFARDIERD